MKIRYDDKGQILAVGDDGCDWPEPLLSLADQDVPDDLLGGLGRYAVRKGKLVRSAGASAGFELPAALRAIGKTAPVAALFEPGGLASHTATPTRPAAAKPPARKGRQDR